MWADEQKLDRLVIRPDYMRIAGGLAGGMLLSQVVYWFRPKNGGKIAANINRDGRLWVAKTHQQWANECQMGLYEVKAQLAKFEQRGWIIQRFWKYGSRPVPHLSLELLRVLEDVYANNPPDGVISDIGFDQTFTSGSVLPMTKSDLDIGCDQTSYLKENSLKNISLGLTLKQEQKALEKPLGYDEDIEEKEPMPTLKELMESKAKATHNPQVVWKSAVSKTYGGFQKPFTNKEAGQIKQINVFLVSIGFDFEKFVEALFSKWAACSTEVRVSEGLATAPTRPVIGWVLQYVAQIASVLNLDPPVEVVQSIAHPVVSLAPTPAPTVEEKMTADEIAKSLDMF